MAFIDPQRSWDRFIASQGRPTRERFDALFAAGDRDGIVALALPLIRKFNRSPKHLRDDIEAFAIGEVVKAVDTLLARTNENPGSYIIDVIRGAIQEARYGSSIDAQQCSPSTERIYRPRPRKSDSERDRLISQLQQQGCSEAMIQAELDSRGFDQPKVVNRECEWPLVPHEETGEPILADFGATDSADEWGHVVELFEAGVLTEADVQLIDAKMQGFTNDECASIFAENVSTTTTRLRRIKTKIQRHDQE